MLKFCSRKFRKSSIDFLQYHKWDLTIYRIQKIYVVLHFEQKRSNIIPTLSNGCSITVMALAVKYEGE
jgi:hypothetical protein